MKKTEVQEVQLNAPIKAVGKIFTGDYAKSQEHILELINILNDKNIPFIANKIMGVYYDNPSEKQADELTSFQGIFLEGNQNLPDGSFVEVKLSGKHIYASVEGDPMKSIYEGYQALFNYIQKNNITLQSNAGYQVATFKNGTVTTEIYMKIV